MLAYRSSLFRSLKKEVSEKLPQLPQYLTGGLEVLTEGQLWRSLCVQCRSCSGGMYSDCGFQPVSSLG